jgi:DNA-binding transcriptional MerR regulator
LDVGQLLSTSAAAREVGVSAQLIRLLAKQGRIRSVDTAYGRLFDPADVRRLADERRSARAAAVG